MTISIKRIFLISLGVLVTALLVNACGGPAAQTPETETIAEVPVSTETQALILPTDVPVVVDECVACHSDKQRLIDTASPEEEVEEENEGAG
jgi:hypothetical protein